MSLPTLVNLRIFNAPPIGSPSPEDLASMTKGIKKDADISGMLDEMKATYSQGDWILASAGGSKEVEGKTKKKWLKELYDSWNKEKRIKQRGFLYVAFQIWTPGDDVSLWVAQKAEGVELLKALDKYEITYGMVRMSSDEILMATDPDDLFSR
tara:strand:- start:219 stop:677 length:459 start_codon:yes stop_codon:yes gene_type:complete